MHRIRYQASAVVVEILLTCGTSLDAAPINVCMDAPTASCTFSDGAFNPVSNYQFDLSQAASLCDCDGIDQGGDLDFVDDECRWYCPSPVAGQGVYDAEQWAVVFKWTSVNIPAGVTVTFPVNHYSRAPVVWLATGSIQVGGIINVNGTNGSTTIVNPEPGPGGFRGAAQFGTFNPPGFGPGGGCSCSHGSYASQGGGGSGPRYGNDGIQPMIGGSGGGNCSASSSAGAGGGAILIAANTSVTLNGTLLANGGTGQGGSGGAIRLVSDYVSGSGSMSAVGGGNAGLGRIRVEANEVDLIYPGVPAFIEDLPTFIFPPANSPKLRATMLGGQPVPLDPASKIGDPQEVDVNLATLGAVTLAIEAENLPDGTQVSVRQIRTGGTGTNDGINNCPKVTQLTLTDADMMPGGLLTGSTNLTFPAGYSVVIMRATFTPGPEILRRPEDARRRGDKGRHGALHTVTGERVVRVDVQAAPGGQEQVVYETETGRRVKIGE